MFLLITIQCEPSFFSCEILYQYQLKVVNVADEFHRKFDKPQHVIMLQNPGENDPALLEQ